MAWPIACWSLVAAEGAITAVVVTEDILLVRLVQLVVAMLEVGEELRRPEELQVLQQVEVALVLAHLE
jgi:hypothetical protein